MKKRNNEVTIKINVSDDLLGALANMMMMSNMPMPVQALQSMTSQSTTEIPPKAPMGFRNTETKSDKKCP